MIKESHPVVKIQSAKFTIMGFQKRRVFMGWYDAKQKYGAGLFHSDYKSKDYSARVKKEKGEREIKRKEREQFEHDIQQSMTLGNKGRDKKTSKSKQAYPS
jgi:hypothetical protein